MSRHNLAPVVEVYMSMLKECNCYNFRIGHVNNSPTMQFSLEIPEIHSQNHVYMQSLTECVRDFQNNALTRLL